jgi:hypothetical protein
VDRDEPAPLQGQVGWPAVLPDGLAGKVGAGAVRLEAFGRTRLYRRCYVEAPRKSGKSSLASAIALYLAYGDSEAAPEIAFAAYDREQASICFNGARYMLEQTPELHAQSAVYSSRKEIQLRDNPGGFLRCLSRESAAQFGLNLHGLIFDELMTQKTRDMWDALTTSQGSREQPLIFAISTAGWRDAGRGVRGVGRVGWSSRPAAATRGRVRLRLTGIRWARWRSQDAATESALRAPLGGSCSRRSGQQR